MNNSNPEITEPKLVLAAATTDKMAKKAFVKPSKIEKRTEPDNRKPFVLKPKKPTSPWIYFNN